MKSSSSTYCDEEIRFNLRSWVIVIMHDGVCQLLQMFITDNLASSELLLVVLDISYLYQVRYMILYRSGEVDKYS